MQYILCNTAHYYFFKAAPAMGTHAGVRFKAQVHHHGDGPGLLGAAISKAVFLTRV